MTTFTRSDVEFTSRGATLRGWLYRPQGDAPSPGIVMTHGFTAVREMFLDRYGEAFAAAGFATLIYDHFGFGASDGVPRQSPTPSWQLEGYRDAIDWLRRQAKVDAARIGLWGSSYSGGHVIMLAAEQLPVRCAVAQVPAIGTDPIALSAATISAISESLKAGRLDDIVPAVSSTEDGVGIMYRDDSYGWFTRVSKECAPRWRNEVRVGAFTEAFTPGAFLAGAKIPLRLIVAPDDKLTPPAGGIATASAVPLIDVARIPGGHFDAYESGFAESSALAIDWFKRHLAA